MTVQPVLAKGLVAVLKAANSTEIEPWETHGIYGMAEEQQERIKI